jgi:hypothetical protein
VAIGLVLIATAVFFIFYTTKSSHLELTGSVLKVRSGALDENSSAAVLDFRVTNVSKVPFSVREVNVAFEDRDGSTSEGTIIAKNDFEALLRYNRFLGSQLNPGLTIRDQIAPHETVDRMVAVRFEIPATRLEHGKALHLHIQDMDGPEFDTVYRLK